MPYGQWAIHTVPLFEQVYIGAANTGQFHVDQNFIHSRDRDLLLFKPDRTGFHEK